MILDKSQVVARIEKCESEGLCFISLKPLDKENHKIIDNNGRAILVNSQYDKR